METIILLDKLEEIISEIKKLGVPPPKDVWEELWVKGTQNEILKEVESFLKDLGQPSIVDINDFEIRRLIFQQKRAMLQRFLDFDSVDEKGNPYAVRVKDINNLEVNFLVESSYRTNRKINCFKFRVVVGF